MIDDFHPDDDAAVRNLDIEIHPDEENLVDSDLDEEYVPPPAPPSDDESSDEDEGKIWYRILVL